jgi:sirohydrochlorin ferrochelatase
MRIDTRIQQQGAGAARLDETAEASALSAERSIASSVSGGPGEDNLALSGLANLTRLALEGSDVQRTAQTGKLTADYNAGRLEVDAERLAEVLAERILG